MNKQFYKTMNFWYGIILLIVGFIFINHSTKQIWGLIDAIFIISAIVCFAVSFLHKPKAKKKTDLRL